MKRKLQKGPFLFFLPSSLPLRLAYFDHNLFSLSLDERDKTQYHSSILIAFIHSRRQISLENLYDITRGWQTRYRWIQSTWHSSKPGRSVRICNVWASLSHRWRRGWHGCGIDIVSESRGRNCRRSMLCRSIARARQCLCTWTSKDCKCIGLVRTIATICMLSNERERPLISRRKNRVPSTIVHLFRSAYVSFGGLLMRLKGDANNLHGFKIDSNVYLLMKKLAFWEKRASIVLHLLSLFLLKIQKN